MTAAAVPRAVFLRAPPRDPAAPRGRGAASPDGRVGAVPVHARAGRGGPCGPGASVVSGPPRRRSRNLRTRIDIRRPTGRRYPVCSRFLQGCRFPDDARTIIETPRTPPPAAHDERSPTQAEPVPPTPGAPPTKTERDPPAGPDAERALAGERPAEKRTIVLVEDNEDNRRIYSAILEHHGFRVVEAADGETALRHVRSVRPAVVLLDISIPIMDGFAVVRELKKDADTRSIPVVALTAHALPEDERKARALGCASYLSKPVKPRRVLEEVLRFTDGPPARGSPADGAL